MGNISNFRFEKMKRQLKNMKTSLNGDNKNMLFVILAVIVGIIVVSRVLSGLFATPMTYVLIGINLAVFAAVYFKRLFVYNLGTSYEMTIRKKEYYRIVTSAFTHQEPLHILMNMYSLYNIGTILERFMGSIRFTVFYVIIMIAGGFLSANIHKEKDPQVFSIGASGVICGLLGMYMVIVFVYMGFSGIRGCLPTILLLVLMTFSKKIDSIGHFSGLLVGLVCGIILLFVR